MQERLIAMEKRETGTQTNPIDQYSSDRTVTRSSLQYGTVEVGLVEWWTDWSGMACKDGMVVE